MELLANYYGQVELIPDLFCDGYVINDKNQSAVLSERATAELLNIDHMALLRMKKKGFPKSLQPFFEHDFSLETATAKVTASNSHFKGRSIQVYSCQVIESIIRAYSLALAHDALKESQKHIAQRCIILQSALVRTALEASIKEACGFIPDIQQTIQRHYKDALFAMGREILLNALKVVYPNREDIKYRGLMATCFKYCYQDVLGVELYKKIKQDKKSYPIHQYIAEQDLRKLCLSYIHNLASQIAVRECKTADARKYTRELLRNFLAIS